MTRPQLPRRRLPRLRPVLGVGFEAFAAALDRDDAGGFVQLLQAAEAANDRYGRVAAGRAALSPAARTSLAFANRVAAVRSAVLAGVSTPPGDMADFGGPTRARVLQSAATLHLDARATECWSTDAGLLMQVVAAQLQGLLDDLEQLAHRHGDAARVADKLLLDWREVGWAASLIAGVDDEVGRPARTVPFVARLRRCGYAGVADRLALRALQRFGDDPRLRRKLGL